MRSIAVILVSLLLASPVCESGEDDAKNKAKPPPPPPGIWWEKDFEAGRARAVREGRPLLFCINAIENERANNELAGATYKSRAWGQATRGYVAFVCNPNDHMAAGPKACTRYDNHVCAGHQTALTWFTKRFGDALISPQHVILEPDGDVAYRKEYYTGVVSPSLLENYLSNIAPRTAYARAGIGRGPVMKRFGEMDLASLDGEARDWLSGTDGFAAAALVNVLDECYDAARRKTLIRALRHTHDLQVPVLTLAAEERVLWPADEPEETALWIDTLFAADRPTGVWAATRVLVRAADAAARDRVLRAWAGRPADAAVPQISDLPAGEQPYAYEALLLAGDARAQQSSIPAGWTAGRRLEIDRATHKGRIPPVSEKELAQALSKPQPGPLRRALLGAPAAAVRLHSGAIVAGLSGWRWQRARVAGALALLKARGPHRAAALPILAAALDDPIEGPATRRIAAELIGSDPGRDRAAWLPLLAAQFEGGAR